MSNSAVQCRVELAPVRALAEITQAKKQAKVMSRSIFDNSCSCRYENRVCNESTMPWGGRRARRSSKRFQVGRITRTVIHGDAATQAEKKTATGANVTTGNGDDDAEGSRKSKSLCAVTRVKHNISKGKETDFD
ncbi:hypothetical protein Tcan_11068 [Toxocara canis]|uniref:Uncharacterized protein n=1 Tax=Toxocara canis TaxID=6265 RepID=A0A0B2URD0_TOXCA|nr:hypothetical protein Tcan_11068 [Toxocara canis]